MKLKNLIQEFSQKYPHKQEHVLRTLDLLGKYDGNTPFYRDCYEDGHFTSSILVINRAKTKTLLMHHKKLGTWQQFGGHADGDSDLHNVAIKELEEEAGIYRKDIAFSGDILNMDVHYVPAFKGDPEHYHYDVSFLAIVDDDITFERQESEVNDIAWFDVAYIKKHEANTSVFSSGLMMMIENV